jgi:DNA-binding PadR family transcriptional regulator
MERRETLSLNEWAVLGCLVERPRHGYDIASELAPQAELGAVWRVSRQLVYRALDRLVALGLAEPRGAEPGDAGPPRQVLTATHAGRERVVGWVAEPVDHLREVRGALLLKLLVGRRLGVDPRPLVTAQRARFERPLAALAEPPPPGDAVALWRHHSAAAVGAFLDDLAAVTSGPSGSPGPTA